MKKRIYLDDYRIPVDPEWILVKDYDSFVEKVSEIGLENIEVISLDHDLGDQVHAIRTGEHRPQGEQAKEGHNKRRGMSHGVASVLE